MEKLDFKFSEAEFANIPTVDFQGYSENANKLQASFAPPQRDIFYKEEKPYQPKENLEFTSYANKENIFSENQPINMQGQTLQKVRFELPYFNPPTKRLVGSKKSTKKKSTNKFIKPVQKSKSNFNKEKMVKKEWDDDVITKGVFQKVLTNELNVEKIKMRNYENIKKTTVLLQSKDKVERKKYKTYQTPQLLQESLVKESINFLVFVLKCFIIGKS